MIYIYFVIWIGFSSHEHKPLAHIQQCERRTQADSLRQYLLRDPGARKVYIDSLKLEQ